MQFFSGDEIDNKKIQEYSLPVLATPTLLLPLMGPVVPVN